MRITPFMIFDQLTRSLKKNLSTLSGLENQLATTKRINKPSDDVIGFMRSMDYKVSINSNAQFTRNVDEATAQLEFVDTALTSLSDTLRRAREVALSAASGALTQDVRYALTQEAAQLRGNILNLGNTVFRDRHVFAGFRTDQPAFNTATYAYQGDNGVINAPIDYGRIMPVNVIGSDAFAYTLTAPETVQISGGRYVHYTPGAGTTVNVEIRDTDDITVLDTFSFSNVVQITDLLSSSISAADVMRIEALSKPLDRVRDQVITVQSEVGIRLAELSNQTDQLKGSTASLQTILSKTEDADIAETITSLTRAEASIKALLESSSRVLSQSLLDFLR